MAAYKRHIRAGLRGLQIDEACRQANARASRDKRARRKTQEYDEPEIGDYGSGHSVGTWNWREWAKCKTGVDPNLFYKLSSATVRAELAAICDSCPVRGDCLDFVLQMEQGQPKGKRHGFWAGTTALQRHRMARAQQAGSEAA